MAFIKNQDALEVVLNTMINPVVFDIETTELDGLGGVMFVACLLHAGGCDVYRIDEFRGRDPMTRELKLIEAVVERLSEFRLWIGHNVRDFDIPFLDIRLIQLGSRMRLPSPLVYDTRDGAKRANLRTPGYMNRPSRSLTMMMSALGLNLVAAKLAGVDERNLKTRLTPEDAQRAVLRNDKAAIDTVVAHCYQDVVANAALAAALLNQDRDRRAIIRRR